VVESQTANLIPSLFFGHILCFKCPNVSWNLILDIFVSIDFQWYKKLFNPLCFNPYNRSLKIWESTETPNSQSGGSFRSVRVHSSHFPSLPGFLLARNLTSPCLGREPKARVAIIFVEFFQELWFEIRRNIKNLFQETFCEGLFHKDMKASL